MYLFVYVASILILATELQGLKCESGTYHKFRKDGRERCKKCPLCNAGEGWNTSVEVITDAKRGFLGCFPCERCPEGYYRKVKSLSQLCYECRLDCKRLKRYGSVQCGYDTPGHCGDCMLGFRPESSEPNNICRKQVTTSTTALSYDHEFPWQQSDLTLDSAQIVLLILGILLLLTAVAVAIYLVKRYMAPSARVPSSEEGLCSNVPSSVSKCDLEIDGPTPVSARTDLQSNDEMDPMFPQARCTYRELTADRVIEKDDETLSIISTNISGKSVQVFFRCLQIRMSKIEPHEELWEKQHISYPNYILNVLIEWTQSAQPKPTLRELCSALEKASFNGVIYKILALAENQSR